MRRAGSGRSDTTAIRDLPGGSQPSWEEWQPAVLPQIIIASLRVERGRLAAVILLRGELPNGNRSRARMKGRVAPLPVGNSEHETTGQRVRLASYRARRRSGNGFPNKCGPRPLRRGGR